MLLCKSLNYVPLKLSNQDILLLGKTNLWIILFGILIEWKKARKIALVSIKLNLLIIPAILLIIYSFIPISTWVNWLSVWFSVLGPWGITFFANYIHIFLSCSQAQVILAILAGILLVRSVETGDEDSW